jgi:hypothetical protein
LLVGLLEAALVLIEDDGAFRGGDAGLLANRVATAQAESRHQSGPGAATRVREEADEMAMRPT